MPTSLSYQWGQKNFTFIVFGVTPPLNLPPASQERFAFLMLKKKLKLGYVFEYHHLKSAK